MARWSSGQDGGLSRRKQEFDSPTGHHFPFNCILILAERSVKIDWQRQSFGFALLKSVGADCREGPPVPIPNTVVKLVCAYDTWRATARENR